MRRFLGLSAAALLAATALPALAGDTDVLPGCDVPAGVQRLAVGAATSPIGTPSAVTGPTSKQFLLDLGGQPVGTTANLDTTAKWGYFVNDYDLTVDGPTGSGEGVTFNPTTQQASDSAFVGAIPNCSVVTVTMIDAEVAPVVIDTISLDLVLSAQEPYVEDEY